MSETKTPNAGEWWVSGSSLIAYVVGLTLDGNPAWQQKGSRQILSDEMQFFMSCFRHEPRCTGFDWVEPVDVDDIPLNPVPGTVVATGTVTLTPVQPDMAAIVSEHTQQVRELTQRIGDLVQQVNQRDAVIEAIRTALRQEYSV
jgi:hypothetical protein